MDEVLETLKERVNLLESEIIRITYDIKRYGAGAIATRLEHLRDQLKDELVQAQEDLDNYET